MAYVKKTDRPRAYPQETITQAVDYAREHGINAASRTFPLSAFTIRRHLILRGHKPNPVGNRLPDHITAPAVALAKKLGNISEAARQTGIGYTAIRTRLAA